MPSSRCDGEAPTKDCEQCCPCGCEDGEEESYTERRTVVEQIKSVVAVDSRDSNEPQDYNFNVTTVKYDFAISEDLVDTSFSTQPVRAEIFGRPDVFNEGKVYTKPQLEAHIKNLQTILESLA